MSDCYIVGAGDFYASAFHPGQKDFVIAADGGLSRLSRADYIVGDFDSLGYVPDTAPVERHPVMKDDTDMALSADIALARGYRRIMLFGGTGGRLDHTLANLQLLRRIERAGAEGYLIGEDGVSTCLEAGEIQFDASHEGLISVFSLSERAEGVQLTGLRYPLTDATLTCDRALGVSNEFLGVESHISVRRGCLLIVWRSPVYPLPRRV